MSKSIVFVIDTNTAGGSERVIATLANYMSIHGYETSIINSDSSSSFYSINNKVTVLKMNLDRQRIGKFGRFIKKYKYLKGFFKQKRPDAVVSFLFNMEAPTILAGLSSKTKVFTSVRNTARAYPWKERVFRKLFYSKIAGVVFQSRTVQGNKDYIKLKNSTVIMNPLADDVKGKMNPIPYSQRRNLVISVGRLEKQKNHEMTIRAFNTISNDYPEYELHIFGDGSLKEQLQNLILELGLNDRVFLDGAVSRAIFKNMDAKLFVMASNFEGFPNALVESMVCGIPTISTDFDTGVAAELIQDGINGWLVKVGDIEGLSQKMKQVLSMKDGTDRIAEESVNLFDRLNSELICAQWEKFIFSN